MVISCSGWVEPLNLQCLLVNMFAGTWEIFIFIALIGIAIIATIFRMINTTLLVIFALFAIFMGVYVQGVFIYIGIIVGLLLGITAIRLMSRT